MKNPDTAIQIREMTIQELEEALGWAKVEGWNPGRFDYRSYHALDRTGFLGLFLKEEMIASISIVSYQSLITPFVFVGLFIVKPEHRRQGYGGMLWDYAMRQIEKMRSIALYAVPQQVGRYKKNGFFERGKNSRLEMQESVQTDISHLLDSSNSEYWYKEMVKYDVSLWGASRENFFDAALQQQQTFAFVSVDKDGGVDGYGMIRPCIEGYRVGPFYADSAEGSKNLARVLLSCVPEGSKITFDIPGVNIFAVVFAEYFRLSPCSAADTFLMVKGELLPRGDEKCYGLSSLEVG